MKNSIVERFIDTCKTHSDRPALISGCKMATFGDLLDDIYKAVALFKAKGLKQGDMALILVPPSYEFYLLMLAGIYYGINLVAMDSYKSINAVNSVLKGNNIRCVFCNRKTAVLKPLLHAEAFVNIEEYSGFDAQPIGYDTDSNRRVLTTFTSGTTGTPKPIHRSVDDFKEQIDIISQNIDIDKNAIVYSRLPIYVLFILFNGMTCVIGSKLSNRRLQKLGVTVILAPIAHLLRLKTPMPFIKRVSIGGAMLYKREAERLICLFPNADISYVYGSSECVLMAKADLREYVCTGSLQSNISGVDLRLINPDKNGVGQICVAGRVVLTGTKEHISSDLGRLDGDCLAIVGRMECSEEGRYNYLLDSEILGENPHVKRGFSIVKNKKVYFCYEGRLSQLQNDVDYIRFFKLPMDAKHKTKLNYKEALKKIHL